jgi:proteasome lid subunit RPN8/RPN11
MRVMKEDTLKKIYQHAIDSYPDECCGIITGRDQVQTVHICRNIQNRLHAEDPVKHPRDARTAYAIDRREAERIFTDAKEKGEDVIGFYHSHTDHEAYFSEMDVAVQTVFGEPEFPEAIHIVVSVIKGMIHDIKCFRWEGETKTFVTLDECG